MSAAAGAERRFGSFLLHQELGRGGMGVVYRAEEPALGRVVALKLLREPADEEDPATLERFLREARTAARLRHPGIVSIHEVGEVEGRHFFTMDCVAGEDLGRILDRGPLPPRRALGIARDVAVAVQHAHEHGVIHRDLKPANVLVEAGGRVLVSDFGLAKDLKIDATRLSASGSVCGTPAYMAPEQARGDAAAVGPASDVYALGALLYHLLTGRPPFTGDGPLEVLLQVLARDPPAPRALRPEIPRDAEAICRVALDKEPARRYASAAAFAADCDRCLRGEPVAARPPGPWRRFGRVLARRRGPLGAAVGSLAAIALAAGVLLPRVRERELRLTARAEQKRLEAAIAETRPFFYVAGGDLDARLGRIEGMLARLEAIANDPAGAVDADVWVSVGMGRYFIGDTEGAEAALLRADVLAPANPRVGFYLGRIYLERAQEAMVNRNDRAARTAGWTRARELTREAARWLDRPADSGSGGDTIERELAAGYRALAAGQHAEVAAICRRGIERPGAAVGTEEFWFLLAWVRAGQERIDACDRALAVRPHFAWACFARGTAREGRGEAADAAADYAEAARINRHFLAARIGRARAQALAGDPAGGLATIGDVLRAHPHSAEAWCVRGVAHEEARDAAGAIADYTEAVRLDPGFLAALNNRGNVRSHASDPRAAVADYEAALRVDPQYVPARVGRGVARLALGDAAGSAADCDEALRLDPANATAHKARADARLALGDAPGAAAAVAEALRLDPGFARAYVTRAQVSEALRDLAAAAADLDTALRLEPRNPDAWYNRGVVRQARGELDGAIADYTAALRLDPRCAAAFFNRGNVLLDRGDWRRAIGDYDEALRIDPGLVAAWSNRGRARSGLGDTQGALSDFDEALRRNPAFVIAYVGRGLVHHVRQELDEAIADFDRAIRLEPGHAKAWLNRGNARAAHGDLDGAIADFDETIRLAPRIPEVYGARGDVRGARGDRAGRLADYEKALEVAPPDWPLRARVEAAVTAWRREK